MPTPRHLYDPKCGELAEHFLADRGAGISQRLAPELAIAIQDAVETWFACLDMALLAMANSSGIRVEEGREV